MLGMQYYLYENNGANKFVNVNVMVQREDFAQPQITQFGNRVAQNDAQDQRGVKE